MQLRIICKFLVTDVVLPNFVRNRLRVLGKKNGPTTEPWGTPYFKGKGEEFKSPIETDCVLLVK